jgi:hypothetical protein
MQTLQTGLNDGKLLRSQDICQIKFIITKVLKTLSAFNRAKQESSHS